MERDQFEAEARKLIPDADDRTPITDPLSRLLEVASEADAFRESLRHLSNKLNDRIRYAAEGAGTEQLRAEVSTYRQVMKDLTDLLIAIARLNIDDRLARISERQGQQMGEKVRAVFLQLNLTIDQQQLVQVLLPKMLREIAD